MSLNSPIIKTVSATEYIAPLPEGGSLPAIVRADDGILYGMKFIGAGQGPKALVAELIVGEIARVLGFNMPEIVLIILDPIIGRSEPNPEIQDLLQASAGTNIGLQFLSHSVAFNLLASPPVSAEFASALVWFDAFVTNMDRTPRNVNMLIHQEDIWLIDHGAALYFHYNWHDHLKQGETPFPMIKDHVLLSLADGLDTADTAMKQRLTTATFETIVANIPDAWLSTYEAFDTADDVRRGYVEYLMHRLEVSHIFVEEAKRARTRLV